MQPKRTYTSLPVGALFASHIFGGAIPISQKASFNSRPKRVPATREEKVTFTSLTENVTPVLAVLPFLNSKAFAETMDNFRLYKAHYNLMVNEANTLIELQNAKIALMKQNNEFTEVQKQFSAIFYKRNSSLKPKEFNTLADAFNAERGLTIEILHRTISQKQYRIQKIRNQRNATG